jgi:hypothetical protein
MNRIHHGVLRTTCSIGILHHKLDTVKDRNSVERERKILRYRLNLCARELRVI